MMSSSDTFTFQAIDGRGVDPRTLQLPTLLSVDAFIAAVEECCPTLPPSIDDFARTPDLVPDDGSSQSSSSPSCSPQARAYTYLPQEGHIDPGLLRHPTTPTSSNSPSHRVRVLRVLIEAPCAGGVPLKQNDWSFCCSVCGDRFGRRDEAKRHIDTAGMRVQCRYCKKSASGRPDDQQRHVLKNQNCLKLWTAGKEEGRFTDERSAEDAFYD